MYSSKQPHANFKAVGIARYKPLLNVLLSERYSKDHITSSFIILNRMAAKLATNYLLATAVKLYRAENV